ncbi:MAG: Epimerase family protein [Chlamydiae bacterium]|nr:Epimerase family protein [Chlamydiota bacterium]
MNPSIIRFTSELDHPDSEVFDFLMKPAVVERLIPPWQKVRITSKTPSQTGCRLVMQVKIGPFWVNWITEHQSSEEEKCLTAIQVKGPFPVWKHISRIVSIDGGRSRLEEEIHFLSPFWMKRSWVEKRVRKMLKYRHETIAHDHAVYQRYPSPPLRILISGSHGFIGSALLPFLKNGGHEVVSLVRKKGEGVFWNPKSEEHDPSDFEGFDVVIHLAGKNLASGLWTKAFKRQVFQSRCRDSWFLSQILSRTVRSPSTLISASAIGIYGNRGEETLSEKSLPGEGFLANLCEQWERSFSSLEGKKTRLVHTRFGIVLSPGGGMLARLLPSLRLGLGAVLGSGKQWVSWIALDDLIYGLYALVTEKGAEGPFNLTAPHPERAKDFTRKLAKGLGRPCWLRIGESPLHFAFGAMADEMLLSSAKALPEKLIGLGFRFHYPKMKDFMDHSL